MADYSRVSISREGAEALRQFSQAMPYAAEQILQDTQTLTTAYNAIASDFGQIEAEFAELVEACSIAAERAAEAISDLPQDLERTAGDIDAYLSMSYDHQWGDQGGSGESEGSPRIGSRTFDTKVHTHRR